MGTVNQPDGFGSTADSNSRYPDRLAERLAAWGRPRPVLNSGIGSNLLLSDSAWFGDSALARFQRDVLGKPGVDTVIVLAGLNDIGFSEVDLPTYRPNTDVSVGELAAGYRRLVERARSGGVRVLGATLLPFAGPEYHTPRSAAERTELNQWIRDSGTFDAVVDFGSALAAPGNPERLNPLWDSGDHKHPHDAGYRIMADRAALALERFPRTAASPAGPSPQWTDTRSGSRTAGSRKTSGTRT
ncbi:SGNH/GDSL hydrolase family protein [Streptantibioticus ferralitis]|uniref:SGNH/GDSL hydrolase family protein n=1 Tax=Streptantibioticus ferralitis TaxID=236510 RepID=A0ABT5Z553_9ACTN|nr:SGNH/GDSL hydrolase family protein [Streptantibioticus ferralitis]MDF2258195.1 SGNH/GDSL hydrolase family protein [Streptantibioticus ferralitis]